MVRGNALITEVLLAAGSAEPDREFGCDPEWLRVRDEESPDDTFAGQIMSSATLALGQLDDAALRTALLSLAGTAIRWIKTIDSASLPDAA